MQWSKPTIRDTGPCQLWKGAMGLRDGYGRVSYQGKKMGAHVAAWIKAYGDTNKLHVLHHCDVKLCINPEHLTLGTNADNMEHKRGKNYGSKLTKEDAMAIRQDSRASWLIAAEYGIHRAYVSSIKLGRVWK